jgi:hypothetical protein
VHGGQRGQRPARHGQAGQNREEQLDPVENVRQHAGHQREQDRGQGVSGLHEGNEHGRVRTWTSSHWAPTVCIQSPALLTRAAIHSVRNAPVRNGAQADEADPEPAMPRSGSR